EEAAETRARFAHVPQAEPRVEQHEPGFGLDEQAVAGQVAAPDHGRRTVIHQLATERAGGDAVQMVDAHDGTRCNTRATGGRKQECYAAAGSRQQAAGSKAATAATAATPGAATARRPRVTAPAPGYSAR